MTRPHLRPALRAAAEHLALGISFLQTALRWVHGTLPEEDHHPSVRFTFICALNSLHEAADIVALLLGDNEGACIRCEIRVATDGDHCAGCHDFLGELQDERAAR